MRDFLGKSSEPDSKMGPWYGPQSGTLIYSIIYRPNMLPILQTSLKQGRNRKGLITNASTRALVAGSSAETLNVKD